VKPESLVSERHYRSLNTSLLLAHTARQANRVKLKQGFVLCQIRVWVLREGLILEILIEKDEKMA